MTETGGENSALPPATSRRYLAPIAAGLLVAAVGLVPWMLLARINARVRPDLPWAAAVSLLVMALLLLWLGGWGPPRRTAARRRELLRLRAPKPKSDAGDGLSAAAVVALLGLLYVAWILMARASPVPDLSEYPTTAYRWSMFLMGGLTAGIVEEAAFRGVMQRGIERFDRGNALWITSLVFVAMHLTQGVGAVLVLGPGLFAASMLYGTLARRTESILPGLLIHCLGDLAHVYFGVLRGDASLLFVR